MSMKEAWSNKGMICPHCEHLNKPEEAHHYSEDQAEQWCESDCDCGEWELIPMKAVLTKN